MTPVERVWHALAGASFAVVSYVTPAGEPRSSGVLYRMRGRRLYVAVAPNSWKAEHIAVAGEVSVTVPIRRGSILSLFLPIPPATISFHATAKVYLAGSPEARTALDQLVSLLPPERRDAGSIIEIVPDGAFLTYGIGVSLGQMRHPASAQARLALTAPKLG